MFIDWACALNLIQSEKNTGILKEFPLGVKRILVQQVVSSFLLDIQTNNVNIIHTPAHLSWVMEVIEQGFLLPLDDSPSIFASIEIYKRWLFQETKLIPLAEDTDEFYMKKILEQLTLVFQPRPITTKDAIDIHTILCQKVLQLYLDIGRALSKNFSKDTMELWITLLLAVADSTLSVGSRMDEQITKAICPLLLKVLFEVWLHSKTENANLWTHLNKYAYGWLHHMPAIHQWNITCLALTSPLVQMVYGQQNKDKQIENSSDQNKIDNLSSSSTSENSNTVSVRLDDISIEMDKEYLLYAWNRILNVVSNPNSIKHPAIFATAIGGIFQLVSILLGATEDGNSILHIFGSWLFEAVKTPRSGFDEGISLATEILSHIFETCAPHIQFEPVYLSALYSCLSEALWCDGKILSSAVIHTQNLLNLELPGVRILVPSYVRALGRILTIIPGSSAEPLRKAAIRILGSLIPLGNRFENIQFFHFFNKRPMEFYPPLPTDVIGRYELVQPDLNTFRDVRSHVAHLILSSLNTETSPSNLKILIWYILAFQLEFQHQNVTHVVAEGRSPTTAFLNGAINILLKKSASFVGQWPAGVVVHSFQLLTALADSHEQIPNFTEFANTIVRKLCKFIVFKCRESVVSLESEELICLAISTMASWAVVNGWIFESNYKNDTSTLYMLFDAITVGMGGKDPNEEITSNSSMSSATSITNTPIGNVPSPNTPQPAQSSQTSSSSSGGGDSGSASQPSTVAPAIKKKSINTRLPARIREAAQCALNTILNRMSCYPNPYNITQSDTSSTYTETQIIEQIKEKAKLAGEPSFPVEQCIRFYTMGNNRLVTIIDQPFGGQYGPYSTIIIRDNTGRYVVNVDTSLMPFKPKQQDNPAIGNSADDSVLSDGEGGAPEDFIQPSSLSSSSSTQQPDTITLTPFDSKYRDNQEVFTDMLNYISRHPDEKYTKYVDEIGSQEQKMLQANQYGLNYRITTEPWELKGQYEGSCKFQHSRMVLASLGFFSLENKGRFSLMDNSVQFYQALKSLDLVAERLQVKAAVYLAKGGNQTEDDVLANMTKDASKDYLDFISALGWPIDLPTHSGYLGGLDRKGSHGKVAPYYATATKEIIFQVPTLMPNQDAKGVEHKKKTLLRCPVSVVWCESIEVFETTIRPSSELFNHHNHTQYAIEPLKSGLFKIKSMHTSKNNRLSHVQTPNTTLYGPINDEIVVSKHILAQIIRASIVNAHKHLLEYDNRLIHPFVQRRRLISDISDAFKADITVQGHYESVFNPLADEQLYKSPVLTTTPSSEELPFKPFKPSTPTNKQRPASMAFSPITPLAPPTTTTTSNVSTTSPTHHHHHNPMPTRETLNPLTIRQLNQSKEQQQQTGGVPVPSSNNSLSLSSSGGGNNSFGSPNKNWGGLKPTSVPPPLNQSGGSSSSGNLGNDINSSGSPNPTTRGNFLRSRPIGLSNEQHPPK